MHEQMVVRELLAGLGVLSPGADGEDGRPQKPRGEAFSLLW